MTYCLAILTDGGVVVAGDSRTSAGPDYLNVVRKIHVRAGEDRQLVLATAGNLATSQEVIARLDRLDRQAEPSLMSAADLWGLAEVIGSTLLEVTNRHRPALDAGGVDGSASFIAAGRIGDHPPGAMLVYPQGNAMAATAETPFVQIGESKYGKPVLDRLTGRDLSPDRAIQLALVSLDATARSNATVAPPYHAAVIRAGANGVTELTFDDRDERLIAIQRGWDDGLRQIFDSLPTVLPSTEG